MSLHDLLVTHCRHRTDISASTAYCWGNFAGPFVVKPSQAPTYQSATAGLLAGYSIKTGCHLLLLGTLPASSHYASQADDVLAYLIIVNRRRDYKYGLADKGRSDEAGMLDKTEFENKDFRYVL